MFVYSKCVLIFLCSLRVLNLFLFLLCSSKYKLSIPSNFDRIITVDYEDWFVVEQQCTPLKSMVYPGKRPLILSSSDKSANTRTNNSEITLPWHEDQWNVFITFPETTTCVWANLLGPDYYEALVDLIDQINEVRLEQPTEIFIKEYYIAVVHGNRQRVRVVEKHEDQYLSHFIDSGEHETLTKDQLYVCDSKFLNLPPQAIQFSLKGLSLFDQLNGIDYCLSDLNEQVMVALVNTTEAQYKQNGNIVEATLYDTSTDINVNVNDSLLEEIAKTVLKPAKLNEKLSAVIITGVLDSGIVTGYLKCKGYKDLIKKEIERVVADKCKLDQCRGISNDIENTENEIYLVWNTATGHYLRATLVDFTRNAGLEEVVVLLIDYGTPLTVNKNFEIYRASLLSKTLQIIPPQAIRMKLHDLKTDDNPNVVSLLRGYLKPCTDSYVKVIEQGNEPSVNIYVKTNDKLPCVNKDIKAQMTLSKRN